MAVKSNVDETALVIGLGNPGKRYEYTRHNIGFRIARACALKKQWEFKRKREFKGDIALGKWKEKRVILLLPMTYMNLSGVSAQAVCRFYRLKVKHILVISDECELPIGTLRYRPKGSSGGHNGLKSIETQLGSQEYCRLKVGIGRPGGDELASYVLTRFTHEEEEKLPQIIDRGSAFIFDWLNADEHMRALAQTIEVI